MYALVEEPLDLSTPAIMASGGAVIVIDFDVGRSFLYDYFGTREFTVLPWLRAVNSAATGTLEGTVTTDSGGQTRPVENANITVCGSQACDPPNAYVVATGRSDAAGRYTVGFLRAGTSTARVEQPDYRSLAPAIMPNGPIAAGDATQLPVSLPRAGSGGAYIRISGPTSVGVGGPILLRAAVGDASGNAASNPAVACTRSNSAAE